jgi:hypothetical protein
MRASSISKPASRSAKISSLRALGAELGLSDPRESSPFRPRADR